MWQNLAANLALDINDANLSIRRAQIRARLDKYVLMVVSQMILALLMVWLMWESVAQNDVLCWLGVLYSAHFLELYFWWRYRQQLRTVQDCLRWRTRFLIFTCLTGAVMGSAGVVMFVPQDIAYQALLIAIMLGLSAGAVTINPVYPVAMYLYTLFIIAPIAITTALVGDQVHSLLAVMLLLYLTFILHTGYELARTFSSFLQGSEDNAALVVQLLAEQKSADEARCAAEQSNRAKSKFLAAASHDLRQPMHALNLYLETLKPHVVGKTGTDLLASVVYTADVLSDMLDTLLEVSRLDTGDVIPRYQQFSMQDIFVRMHTDFAELAQEKKLTLRIESCQVEVYSDFLLLERVLRNLLSNAVRYTERGEISVRGYVIGKMLQIDVTDSGIGIAAEHMPHIFDEYYQVGNQQRTRSQGLGLGLAIVQRTAQLLSCPLHVESKLGVGSRFSLQVPLQTSSVIIKNNAKN